MEEKKKKKIDKKAESGSDKVENGRDGTNGTLLLLPATTKTAEDEKRRNKEWETTKARKKIFLGIWEQTLGSVKATCEKARVPRQTYYNWMHDDPVFAQAIQGHFRKMLEDIDQKGKQKILEGDSAMIRFYLERLHPMFKPKVKIEGGPVAGEQALEQEFDEIKWMSDNKYYGENIKQPDGNTKQVLNPKQERGLSAFSFESGSGLLLEKKNPSESDT